MSEVDLSEFIDGPGATPCKFARILADLLVHNPERYERLCRAIEAKDKVSNQRITMVLKDWGFKVSIYSVRGHRVHECTCD